MSQGHTVSSHKAVWKSKKLISPQRIFFKNQNAQLILKINSLATAYNDLTGSLSYSLPLFGFFFSSLCALQAKETPSRKYICCVFTLCYKLEY